MKEIWKDVPGYENYQISNYGRQRKGDLIFKQQLYPNGYVSCRVYKNNKSKCFIMHRLVMELFKPDKSNFKYMPSENPSEIDLDELEVNHIDENITNNMITNLEWCTSKYNANYGNRNKKCREVNRFHFKQIDQYTLDGVFVKTFETISDAARSVNGDATFISRVAHGRANTAYGYIWKFHNCTRQSEPKAIRSIVRGNA